MTAVDALQTTLAAEHAAVYVYGALGGRTSAVGDSRALRRRRRRLRRPTAAWRDLLTRRLADARRRADAAAAATYELPPPTPTATGVAARGARPRAAPAPRRTPTLVAETVDDERRWAIGRSPDSGPRARSGDARGVPRAGRAAAETAGARDLAPRNARYPRRRDVRGPVAVP